MKKRSKSLLNSLVGSSIEFKLGSNGERVSSLSKTILVTKRRIEKEINLALELGGKPCIMLLAELNSYYSKEPYYMAVRSYITMRRYRPLVQEYLNQTIDERAEEISKELKKTSTLTEHRDAILYALRYFLSTYTGRLRDFKKLLTKEEYFMVS